VEQLTSKTAEILPQGISSDRAAAAAVPANAAGRTMRHSTLRRVTTPISEEIQNRLNLSDAV
jgi:hypothetical protein